MSAKLISIVIGIILVLSTGSLVYVKKEPAYIPPTDTTGTVSVPSNSNTTNKDDDEDEEDEDDEGGGVVTPSPVTPKPTTPTPAPTTSGIAMTEIAKHNSRTNCWSAVNGNVYDLTSWIPNHPGGERQILSMCGIDGSVAYNGQHAGSKKTTTILAGFKLGALAK